ncbi:hypothetical protein EVAR_87847_1 [Eumeta japonica]|uniref:ZP domain-containing protein n=1 Tax=Eumeta variegata TaxID=151549 RepID=A0A4C1YGQ0_EUMVA|nr:hypothetical protein EVAR_87847_1 [Eumeta japonica]
MIQSEMRAVKLKTIAFSRHSSIIAQAAAGRRLGKGGVHARRPGRPRYSYRLTERTFAYGRVRKIILSIATPYCSLNRARTDIISCLYTKRLPASPAAEKTADVGATSEIALLRSRPAASPGGECESIKNRGQKLGPARSAGRKPMSNMRHVTQCTDLNVKKSHRLENMPTGKKCWRRDKWLNNFLDAIPLTISINTRRENRTSNGIELRSVCVGLFRILEIGVTDIQCTFASGGTGIRDSITALLRKPEGFRGSPLFADDRSTDPTSDATCQLRSEADDPTGLLYRLRITDFSKCGVLKRNGFVHVRIWFPQFPGVVMQSDQELIIMCKPPEPTIIENKAAGFAGSFPHGARVSGVVEETPGRLEYEVALYKEAPPLTRHSNHSVDLPVDQAVPIGTKLQLRARINPESAWRHIKLLEVAVSPDPDRPHASGAVLLVKDGCRNREFASIIPHQPARYRERHNEVFLDFEAFLLASMKERSTLWIHSQIKACMDAADCQPDYCLDLYEPTGTQGHGRKRRAVPASGPRNVTSAALTAANETGYTRFKENLEYTVIMPGELFHRTQSEASCTTSMMVAAALGSLLFMSALLKYHHCHFDSWQSTIVLSAPTFLPRTVKLCHYSPTAAFPINCDEMCYLASRLNSTLLKSNNLSSPSGKNFEQMLRDLAQNQQIDRTLDLKILVHPPCSPDLAPYDFCLFPEIKEIFEESGLQLLSEIGRREYFWKSIHTLLGIDCLRRYSTYFNWEFFHLSRTLVTETGTYAFYCRSPGRLGDSPRGGDAQAIADRWRPIRTRDQIEVFTLRASIETTGHRTQNG